MLGSLRLIGQGLAVAITSSGCSGVSTLEAREACALMDEVIAASPVSYDDYRESRQELALDKFKASTVVSDSQPSSLSQQSIVRKVSSTCPETHSEYWELFSQLYRQEREAQKPEASPTPSPQPSPPEKPRFDTQEVSRADFGDDWPLTVEEGVLVCSREGSRVIVTFLVTGSTREYALNASAEGQGFPPINPIWADDPLYASSGAGIKIAITPLRSRALALCSNL